MNEQPAGDVRSASIELDLERFMKSLIRDLSGTLQDVVGLEEASGFVSIVGQRMGERLNNAYRASLGKDQLTREEVADVLVDLKRRIHGEFFVAEQSDEAIVYGNTACPFGASVIGRPAMCMMTSNVFGAIAAENLGYARVELHETIARGDAGCRVTVHLRPPAGEEPSVTGREYFRAEA